MLGFFMIRYYSDRNESLNSSLKRRYRLEAWYICVDAKWQFRCQCRWEYLCDVIRTDEMSLIREKRLYCAILILDFGVTGYSAFFFLKFSIDFLYTRQTCEIYRHTQPIMRYRSNGISQCNTLAVASSIYLITHHTTRNRPARKIAAQNHNEAIPEKCVFQTLRTPRRRNFYGLLMPKMLTDDRHCRTTISADERIAYNALFYSSH